MSELGNQYNNGAYQGQIFDNPSALCQVLGNKDLIQFQVGTEASTRFSMKKLGFSSLSF